MEVDLLPFRSIIRAVQPQKDIREQKNLATQKAGVRRKLADLLGTHLKRVEAQMPINKSTGKSVAMPGSEDE